MKLFRLFILTVFFTISYQSFAQKPTEPDEKTQEKIENLVESSGEDELDFNTLLDQLEYYKEHPLNLNKATREDLQELMILNDLQIDALLKHIESDGKMIAVEELQTVEGFDLETIYRILPYVTIVETPLFENISFRRLLSDGKNSLFIRSQQVLEPQAGYINQDSATFAKNKSYAGSQLKLYSRYRYTLGNRISFGITGGKDTGEEFFKGTQKSGFDFYSAHLFIRGKGIIRSVAIGDFQAQYGQGLVMWSGLAFGKSSDVMNLEKNARGLMPYTSTDENNFMRGGSVSLGLKKFQLDLVFSNHKRDANVITPDSIIQDDKIIVSSLETSGYHRTLSEIQDKHTIGEKIEGGHFQYKSRTLSLGFTGFATQFNHLLEPAPHLYNEFEFSGNHNLNYGVDYSYLLNNFHFFGEIAKSENGGLAYLNGALISLDSRLGLSILQRHLAKDYQNLKSNPISENSNHSNEDGLLIGVLAKPANAYTLSVYFDQFSFPWLRYLVNSPTKGFEYLAQLNYTPNKTFKAYIRVKQQSKPANIIGDTAAINRVQDVVSTDYRFNIRYKISSAFILGNRVDYLALNKTVTDTEHGYMIYQDVTYHPMKSRLSFSVRYILFDTDSYDSRIYSYEHDVYSSYSVPFYDHRGSRYQFVVHYKFMKGIDGWIGIGRTMYDNQQTVSSGLDQINAPHKTDAKAQLRFQF